MIFNKHNIFQFYYFKSSFSTALAGPILITLSNYTLLTEEVVAQPGKGIKIFCKSQAEICNLVTIWVLGRKGIRGVTPENEKINSCVLV